MHLDSIDAKAILETGTAWMPPVEIGLLGYA